MDKNINFAKEILKTDTINTNKYSWNLTDIYMHPDEAKNSLASTKKYDIRELKTYINTNNIVGNDEYFSFKELVLRRIEKLFLYFQLSHLINTNDTETLKYLRKIQSIYNIFIGIIENIEKDQHIAENPKDNNLINNLEEIEEDISNKYYTILSDALNYTYINVNRNKILLNTKNYNNTLLYGNTKQRKKMYILYKRKIIEKIKKDTLYLLMISVNNQNILNNLYDFKPKIFLFKDNQIQKVYQKFKKIILKFIPTFQYYLKLKAEYLNQKKLFPYDLNLDLCGNKVDIPYCDAVSIIFESFNLFDDEYKLTLDMIVNKNWIDVFETDNKIQGAFCFNSYEIHPYILINYDNSLNEFMVLSHEIGHAINFYNSNKNNNGKSSEIFELAREIPSIVSELIVLNNLIKKNYNNNSKLLELKKAEIVTYGIFKGMMQLEFLENIYSINNGLITESYINKIWGNLNFKYYGDRYKATKESLNDWIKIDLFMSNEKRFQYIMGYICSTFIIDKILPCHLNKYSNFLKSGSSQNIAKTFKLVDIELTNTKYIEYALNEISNFVLNVK